MPVKTTPNRQLAISAALLVAGVGVGLLLEFRQRATPVATRPPPAPVAVAGVTTNAAPAEGKVPQVPPAPALPFTGWMAAEAFSAHLKSREATGFWRENWISAAEGRLAQGARQYRIAEEPRPQGRACRWYWWYDMSEEFYQERAADLRGKGFEHVHHQSYKGEDGQVHHQGVWHKVEP